MATVCKQLSDPNLDGLQTCLDWVEYTGIFYSHENPFPVDLTYQLANTILGYVGIVFAFVFIVKKIIFLIDQRFNN